MAGVSETQVNDFIFYTVGKRLYYRCIRLPVPHAFGTDSGIFDTSRLTMMHQVHGTDILSASSSDIGRQYEGYDALVTADPAAVIGCRTADCVPVLMVDEENGICAAVHAGWKGTIAGIALKTFGRMIALGAAADNILIAVGACARYETYEVGDDFYSAVVSAQGNDFAREFVYPYKSGRLHADVPGMDIRLLCEAGAKEENIFDCGLDTISDPRFRSYRREGRREPMLSVISLSAGIPYVRDDPDSDKQKTNSNSIKRHNST